MLNVKIRILDGGRMPTKGSELAAGWDLYAVEPVLVPAGYLAKVPLGVALEIPPGWYAQANPRSGLCAKGIEASVGTIDADYRGELCAVVKNLGPNDWVIGRGDRVVQLVFLPVPLVIWEEVQTLDDTLRGKGGFGSTGV
jgi:dUTP pyrophosphatase